MNNYKPIINILQTHKLAEKIENCEDAYKTEHNLYVVSDGAGQGFLSGEWAELIATYFCNDYDIFLNNRREWLKNIQQIWQVQVRELVELNKNLQTQEWIPYFNAFNQKERAAATLLGAKISKNNQNLTLDLHILGDSCVFIISEGYFNQQNIHIFDSYPLKFSTEFNDTPYLLNSYTEANLDKICSFSTTRVIQENTYILFATDALSKWILQQHEQNQRGKIRNLLTQTEGNFDSWTKEQKRETQLEDDDITLIKIEYSLPSLDKEECNEVVDTVIMVTDIDTNSKLSIEEEQVISYPVEEGKEIIIASQENTYVEEKKESIVVLKKTPKQEKSCIQELEKGKNNAGKKNSEYLLAIPVLLVLIIFLFFIYPHFASKQDKTKQIITITENDSDIKSSYKESSKEKQVDTIEHNEQDTLLAKGTEIYNEQNRLIMILRKSIRVKINDNMEDRSGNIGFVYEGDVFVSKAGSQGEHLNWEKKNKQGFIEINEANLRMEKDNSQSANDNIIGQLKVKQLFDCIYTEGDWCSIRFTGKIKK